MEISYFSNNVKGSLNLQLTMDYDSGYISHNPESNLDISLENSIENSLKCMKPVYLSEDALLEKPIINKKSMDTDFNLTGGIIGEDCQEAITYFNLSDNETVISSSVISQESSYNEFYNKELTLDMSPEIPNASPITVTFNSDDQIVTVSKEMQNENNANNFNEFYDKELTLDMSTEIPNASPITATFNSNEQIVTVSKKIQNENNADNLTVENKRRLMFIFSRDYKENTYSVKRKYPSLSPKKEISVDSECSSNKNMSSTVYEHNSRISVNESSVIKNDIGHCIFPVDFLEDCSKKQKELTLDLGMEKDLSSNCASQISCDRNPSLILDPYNNTILLNSDNDSNKHCLLTPQKMYVNGINPNISPDLFADEERNSEISQELHLSLESTPEERYIVKRDQKFMKRVQNSLKGVLPPHNMTIVQFSLIDMLDKIKGNKNYFWSSNDKSMVNMGKVEEMNNSGESDIIRNSKSLLISGCLENIKNKNFPDVLMERNLGLYYNCNRLSEQIEDLCTKYGQRYVGAETQSTCTVFETNYISPTKRKNVKQLWTVKSPGRRLSHLARRRITFSSANLQPGSFSIAGNRTRQILVDAKKFDILSRRKSPRKTPKKTPNKSPWEKTRTPSSSAKKKLAMRFRKMTGEIENTLSSTAWDRSSSSKRALFQSPDKKDYSFLFPTISGKSIGTVVLKQPAKRTLFLSPNKNPPFSGRSPFKQLELELDKKRKRMDSEESRSSKLSRSISSMSVDCHSSESELKEFSRTKSELNVSLDRGQPAELSATNKKKLQWAVYEALHSLKISYSHPQFKVFASNLARIVRRLIPYLNGTAPRPEGSISARMSRIARHYARQVVKGKSVDEIAIEHTSQITRHDKPIGYIGVQKYKERTLNKENILQNRQLQSQSLLEEETTKRVSCVNNRIERIRKVINFGDDDYTQ